MQYFWWGCRRYLKLITLRSERAKNRSQRLELRVLCWNFSVGGAECGEGNSRFSALCRLPFAKCKRGWTGNELENNAGVRLCPATPLPSGSFFSPQLTRAWNSDQIETPLKPVWQTMHGHRSTPHWPRNLSTHSRVTCNAKNCATYCRDMKKAEQQIWLFSRWVVGVAKRRRVRSFFDIWRARIGGERPNSGKRTRNNYTLLFVSPGNVCYAA